ncbi:HU family DNA-binding protein [Bacteroides propionicifaciens]|uniref:HU family DNA-binding protein n=1 Tax=Bacteroides propionicifaciens TaxID=392838 RepID=UPI00037522AE|nr:HU family DNA-binding protein [Bacteroides propionicifaciens]
MSIIFKAIQMPSNPLDKQSPKRFYPRPVALGQSVNIRQMTDYIKDISSLSRGDVRSVLQNFVEKLKEQLLEGKHVNIEGLGVFSLSLRSKGEELTKDLTAKSISAVRICFLASKELQLKKEATRSSERLNFIRLEDYLKGVEAKEDEVKSEDKELSGEDLNNEGSAA